MNQIGPGIQVSGTMSNGGSQPPRNRIEQIALIRIMLAYSPRKNSANAIAEYFDVVARDQLGLGLGQIERMAVGLGEDRGDEDREHREVAERRPESRLGVDHSERLSEPTVIRTLMMISPIEFS